METFTELFSLSHLFLVVVIYYVTLIFYRLYLHPLARFPGPKLASISRWYEAYYDVVQNGQYTFKIGELHKAYGPIVRISPHELHVNDPAFFDIIYKQEGIWDKYAWSVDAFAFKGAFIFTPGHKLHKARRQPLNPFFSKAKVNARQDMVDKHVDKLCDRIATFVNTQEEFNLGAVTTAYSRDVAFDYILGTNYGSLEKDDFDEPMVIASASTGQMWRTSKHLRFVAPMLKAVPIEWIIKYAKDHGTKQLARFLKDSLDDTEKLVTSAKSRSSVDSTTGSNVVHEIMASSLPPSEKTAGRIWEEVGAITGAAFETTAGAIRTALFHVFDNKTILQKLRAELSNTDTRNLKALEQLPYLKAVLLESMRISPPLGTRLARVAPDRDLVFKQWRIPAGTPVGMSPPLMYQDEELYPEPHRFNPERWLGPDGESKLARDFAPFFRGTRACLGQHLAWAEMYLLVARMVDRFDFRYIDARAEDFECDSDQYAIGTKSGGVLRATVSLRPH